MVLLWLCVLMVLITPSTVSSMRAGEEDAQNSRKEKFLGLLSLVRFPNYGCMSESGDMGTCYTKKECSNKGGKQDGACAQGFGICCILSESSCGGSTDRNNTYFTNPQYPDVYTSDQSCMFRVKKSAENVCQFRFEFVAHELAPPISTGDPTDIGKCDQDKFTVTGLDYEDFGPICGYNTGQHLQLDVSEQSSSRLMFDLSGSFNRIWKIKIVQILCDSDLLAPPGCQQYHIGHYGIIQSFNYNPSSPSTSLHLQNQKQIICVRAEHGFCFIDYEYNPDVATENDAFSVSPEVSLESGYPCTEDYIVIQNGMDLDLIYNGDRYCGQGLRTSWSISGRPGRARKGEHEPPVRSNVRPFKVIFRSDDYEDLNPSTPDYVSGEKGFSLRYRQRTCTVF